MNKIILTQGVQASGKTTFAKSWVLEDPEHRVRFNRDDIRNMLGKYWVPSREDLINSIRDEFLNCSMLKGYDIIIDDMNLNKKTIQGIISFVNEFNEWTNQSPMPAPYEIEYKQFFGVPLETLIERDSKRENPIGAEVITSTYNRYKSQYAEL